MEAEGDAEDVNRLSVNEINGQNRRHLAHLGWEIIPGADAYHVLAMAMAILDTRGSKELPPIDMPYQW